MVVGNRLHFFCFPSVDSLVPTSSPDQRVSNLVHGSSLVLSDDRTLPALIASMGVQLAQSELDNMQHWQAAGETPVEIH